VRRRRIHIVAALLLLGARRSPLALLSLAAVVGAALWVFPPSGVERWIAATSQNAASNPLTVRSIGVSLLWVFAAGPVPVLAGLFALWRLSSRRVRLVAVPAALATCALLFYPEGSFSPRYVLATVPLAFLLPAATWLTTRRWLIVAGLAIPLAMVPIATQASACSRRPWRRHSA
jgi:hypothetical protein